jgi:universal stress protein E
MKNIIVVWDHHTSSATLLAKACDLTIAFDAKVTLCVFVSTELHREKGATHVAELTAQVKTATDRYFKDCPNCTTDILVEDDISGWLNKLHDKEKIDLVIKTGHRSETLFYTPTDWRLIRELDCALLLLSPTPWHSNAIVLAAIDAECRDAKQQAMNGKVLHAAQSFARAKHCSLHAAYNIPIAKALTELDIVEPGDVIGEKSAVVRQALAECLSLHGVEVQTSHITAGDTAKKIPALANKNKVDLVVMGSVGRSGIKGLLLGNTAEKVIHQLRTDLLVIKP